MSLAVLLAQKNEVVILDVNSERVDKVNLKQSTVIDYDIEDFLANKNLNLIATSDKNLAYNDANFIVVATPTNYDPNTNYFDTSSVDAVVSDAIKLNSNALVVIKSTLPIGHTKSLQEKYETNRIVFSPEFLREGKALKDNLYPSRIIVGSQLDAGKNFANLLRQGAKKKNIETLFIRSTEAEAVKLFANTYLAMRVSFFNELDSYAMSNELDAKDIINGMCLDDRIGEGYNNPSFGYGGYCLPKDTKQLLANFDQIPQTLIQATVTSNSKRKNFIADSIINLKPKVVGVFKLEMKKGSDNSRSSAIQGIIKRIKVKDIEVVIYDPSYKKNEFYNSKIISSLETFKNISDLIISNRLSKELNDVAHKVFTRDLFGID